MPMADGEIEYESDPEEAMLSLKLRRREASDDDEEEEVEGGRAGKLPRRVDDDSEWESEGAVAEYEDELEEEEYGEEEVEEDVEIDGESERVETGREGDFAVEVEKGVGNYAAGVDDEEIDEAEGQHEEEKKNAEPFTVPTAGTFYMHDDRFGNHARGRNRRTLGRTLWESKDDRKWGHDKFEELTTQDKTFREPRRSSRGHNRGRGRHKGTDRVNAQGNRTTEYSNNSTQNENNQVYAPKSVKGRGPRRYQQSSKNSYGGSVSQNKQSGKSFEKHSYVSSGRTFEPVSNVSMPRKQVATALNSSSPPFYPTGSSTKDNSLLLKRDVQAGTINRNGQQSVVEENLKKSIVDSIGVGNLYIDDTPSVKPSNSMQVQLSQLQGQGRGLTSSIQMAYQPVVSKNQFNRGPPSKMHNVQRNTGQGHFQASKSAGATNAFESGEPVSTSEPKAAVVAKGKGTVQGIGKEASMYGGTQVMGSGHNDQNFPAFLPVMQFGGQHPRGMGVPAVGMVYPGYVAQSQLGLGSSEMTWLPVLAGPAGALGASYCPQYFSMDGSYNAQPSGQMSSISDASSKENNAAKVGNDVKPTQSLELANDNFGQRQKNPRRYTDMEFGPTAGTP